MEKRHHKIIDILLKNKNSYVTSDKLAFMLNVSVRTIKSDISKIKQNLDVQNFTLESKRGEGYRIVLPKLAKAAIIPSDINSTPEKFDEQSYRVKYMLYKLLLGSNYNRFNYMDVFYISESQFYLDLNLLKDIISKYNLNLTHCSNNGYTINGEEYCIRTCMCSESLLELLDSSSFIRKNLHFDLDRLDSKIEKLLKKSNICLSEDAKIRLKAMIIVIHHRIKSNNLINLEWNNFNIDSQILSLSEEIIIDISCIDNLLPVERKEEIVYLGAFIQSLSANNNFSIEENIRSFIIKSLDSIFEKFSINFFEVDNFITLLCDHVQPLILRLKIKNNLVNDLNLHIKQTYPIATNIATYFSQMVEVQFDVRVTDDEIAYITSYFNYGLHKIKILEGHKQVVILGNLRESEQYYVKHELYRYFANKISSIAFARTIEGIVFDEFDVFLTLDSEFVSDKMPFTFLKLPLNTEVLSNLSPIINGFLAPETFLTLLNPKLFFSGSVENKEEIFTNMFSRIENFYGCQRQLIESVFQREAIGDTYFGNMIALPHPMTPVTDSSFMSVAVLNNPIKWNETDEVRIVILICLQRGAPEAFRIWEYLSNLVVDETLINQILQTPNFENFVDVFTSLNEPK